MSLRLTPRLTPRRICLLLVALHLMLAAAYSVWNPLGEAPDEADHWAYVVYLAEHRALPVGPQVTQSKHPPLFHATAAAVASLSEPRNDFLRANPDVAIHPGPTQSPNFFIHTTLEAWPWQNGACAFHLARLWAVLLSGLTVAAVYGLGRAALPHRVDVALLATGLAATLPEFIFIGSSVNNDGAAALFATLGLWGGFALYQGQGRLRAGWWAAPALGLGLLTKVSTAGVWPVVALAIVLGAARAALPGAHATPRAWLSAIWESGPRWVGTCLAVFLSALLIAAPWWLRNWQLYGDPLGMELARATVDQRVDGWGWAETVWLVRGWFTSFWGKFGAVGHLVYPQWVDWLFAALSAAGAAGLVVAWRRDRAARLPMLLWLLACLTVAAGIWRYSLVALGTDQGRLLFPAFGPLLLLLALGLIAWMPVGSKRALGALLVGGMALLTVYGLAGVIRPAYAPPPSPAPAEVAALPPDGTPIHFGELTLAGWQLNGHPLLYWQAEQAPTQDWRVTLRIVAEDGSLVWEWRRSPGYGRFSTDRWPRGTLMSDAYTITWPEWAGPGRYRVEVGLSPLDGDFALPLAPANAADPDHPYIFLGWLERG